MYAARRTGLKKEMFGYVCGGYDKINTAFEKKLRSLGVSIMVNTQVKQGMSAMVNQIRIIS